MNRGKRKTKKIGWGIIGLGIQGRNIAEAIHNSSNGMLIGAVSRNRERAKTFAQKHGAKKYYDSYKKLLNNKEIKAVFIASPNYQHAAQTRQALNSGKHVLCEKPMALSMKDGRAIKKTVEKNNLIYRIGFHFRHHPVFQKAKSIIGSGQFGKILTIQIEWSADYSRLPPMPEHMKWRDNPKKAGGGTIITRGIHIFDILQYITGRKITEVAAYTDNKKKIFR